MINIYKDYIKNNLDYPKDFLEYLFSFNKTISISIKKPYGIFKGYRVYHNNDFGIYKGGFRLHKNVSLETFNVLSFLMTLKNSLYSLPFGGAKGGICIDKSKLSKEQIEEIIKDYIKELKNDIGENKDVLAPDLGTNEDTMRVIFENYKNLTGENVFTVVTGKPEYLMGINYRKKATGYGAAYFLLRYLEDENIKDVKIGIYGFGNVGKAFAEKITELGFNIKGVSDSKGGILCNKIDIKKLKYIKKSTGSVINYPNCKVVSPEDFLKHDFDIIVLSAVENSINFENIDNIKSKIILEAANFGIQLDVEDILLSKKIVILPDIMVNAGGVFISYYEYIKGKTFQNFTDQELDKYLKDKVNTVYKNVILEKNSFNLDFRKASLKISLDRLYNYYTTKFNKPLLFNEKSYNRNIKKTYGGKNE